MIPTAGGGRAVVFNDVEVLTQTSPDRDSPRKRSYEVFEVSLVNVALSLHYKIGWVTEKYLNLFKTILKICLSCWSHISSCFVQVLYHSFY